MIARHLHHIAVAAAAVLWGAARADPVGVVNALRAEGCGDGPAAGTPLRPVDALDDVARSLSRERRLEEALAETGFPAEKSASYHLRGSREDEAIREILAERFCGSINDSAYEEIGVFGRRDETWIVLAVRRVPQAPLDPAATAERVLELINAARAQARPCGRDRYEAAGALTLSARLNEAASAHAADMAARGRLGHRGSDGSEPGERITRAGYRWRASGENVAAGQPDAETVVAAWLESPGHCATLMGPYFTETGIAFALAPAQDPEIYWAQVFAAPLP